MRALMFRGPMDLAWEEVETPQLMEPRDALVRPIAVARCDLDPAIALGLYPMPAPFVMGHEMVGEVVAVGEAISNVRLGDKVIVPFQLSCMTCAPCLRGHTNACVNVPSGTAFGLGPHGGIDLGGALAELVRVPWADVMLIPLPEGMDPVVAAGIPDNVSDGYRCVAAPLAERPGAPVLVVGGLAPSVGLYAVMAALALGSERVVYVDDDAARLELAAAAGAEVIDAKDQWDSLKLAERFPIVVDANVLDPGRNFALRSVEPCGVCTSVSGGASSRSNLPLQSMYLKGVRYEIGRVHACATARPVLDLVSSGALDPARIINKVVPFSEAVEGMILPVTKVVFVNDFV
ncbi:MAG: alcohol dehydrogenase catalytic domain-containing protein [Ilumatobacteraceae bacterium]|nr:alcohol dehydrogenase catalytic domain-containing protein [Ilumatobacteraceae bacterium]